MLSHRQSKDFFLNSIRKLFPVGVILCVGNLLPAQISEDIHKAWKETLLYGVDAELSEILRPLAEHKEPSLRKEVLERAESSSSAEVKKLTLIYFQRIKNPDAREFAQNLFLTHQQESTEVLQEALRYVDAVFPEDPSFLPFLYDLLDNDPLRQRAITSIGVMGDSNAEKKLRQLYHTYRDEDSRGNILIALGSIGSTESRDFLLTLVEDPSLSGSLKRYAITSLAQCSEGDRQSMQGIIPLASSDDQWVRAYAVAALRNFSFPESEQILQRSLKDNFWRVRIFALQGIATLKVKEAVSAVRYKAQKDPELVVRREAITTLASIATLESQKALQEIAESLNALPTELHGSLAVHLLSSSLATRLELVKSIVDWNIGTPNSPVVGEIAQYISSFQSRGLEEICSLLLKSPSPRVQISALQSIAINKIQALQSEVRAVMQTSPLVQSYAEHALAAFKGN